MIARHLILGRYAEELYQIVLKVAEGNFGAEVADEMAKVLYRIDQDLKDAAK